jgi:hypothetical protein
MSFRNCQLQGTNFSQFGHLQAKKYFFLFKMYRFLNRDRIKAKFKILKCSKQTRPWPLSTLLRDAQFPKSAAGLSKQSTDQFYYDFGHLFTRERSVGIHLALLFLPTRACKAPRVYILLCCCCIFARPLLNEAI